MRTTLGRMAKLYGLHRSTLYEAVSRGRVSAGFDGKGQRVVDLSEMIRVYGEPPTGQTVKPDTPTAPTLAPDTSELLAELRLLREEVAGLRAELRLIEHKPDRVAIGEAIEEELQGRHGGDRTETKPENLPACPQGDTRDIAAKQPAGSFADLLAGLE